MDLSQANLIKIQVDETGQHIIAFTSGSDCTQQQLQNLSDHQLIDIIDQDKLRELEQSQNTLSNDQPSFVNISLPINNEHISLHANINTNILTGVGASDGVEENLETGNGSSSVTLAVKEVIESSINIQNSYLTAHEPPILKFNKYAEFKIALHEFEAQTITKYILRNQTKDFVNDICLHDILNMDKGNTSDVPLIRWEFCGARDFLPIPFMGIPYISIGKQVFQCHQGKDYNQMKKRQYELQKEILNKTSRVKIKSRDKGPSKKIDCPVLFGVRKIYTFPEHEIQTNSKRVKHTEGQILKAKLIEIKSQKCNCKELIKKRSDEGLSEMIGALQYLVRFPVEKFHNHDVSKAASFLKTQLKKPANKNVELIRARKSAEANPYQYDKHVELIKVLRSSGDLDQLRSARETMSSIYPLSEDLWLEWFEDELPLAQLSEQREYLLGLFEAAVKDYASVKIWNEYCQFLMNNIDTPADIDRTREIFERAIVVVGLNVTEGSSIWNGYRDFESAILDSYQQLEDSGETVGLSAKVQHQIEKINHIFRRQLSIPLMGMKDTMQAYEDWAPDIVPTETMRAYEKALQKLTLCIEYEEKLQNAVGNKLEEYNEYIKYELKDGDPARIQCLYERAIKDNCLQHELWERYASYLDYKLKIAHISVTVYERAIRNCPWISNLWTRYFRALERNNTSLDVIEEKFEQSLKGGFSDAQSYLDVWLEQCYYYKRKITDWDNDTDGIELLEQSFEQAIKYMSKYFGLEGDKEFVLMKELAYIQAKYLKDWKKAQELWDTIVKVKSKDPNTWLEYIQFLKLYGDVPMVRRAFQRAIQISFENPEIICNAFLTFERRYANLIELDDAQQKVDVQLHRAKERKEKEALRDNNPNQKDLKNNRKPKKFDKQNLQDKKNLKNKRKLKQQQHNTKHSEQLSNDEPNIKKGKTSDEKKDTSPQAEVSSSIPTTSTVFKLPSQPVATTPKVTSSDIPMEDENVSHESGKQSSNMTENSGKSHSEIARETCSTSEVTTNMSTEHDGERSQQVAEHVDEQGDAIEKVDDELSVFLSNLLFTVEEVHIQNMFEKCGEIETIRLIKKKMGKSKGFAYLQFKQKYSVEQALLLDREALQGRPVFVSRCVDKKTNPTQFKFPTKLDKCTLYVTNIPFELSSDELSELFGQCGKLKQTRVVTNRSGKSRGFAYIEYETETDASSALIKLDKHVINNRPINVSLSNPPSRKQNKSNDNNTSAGNVRDQQNTGIRVKSKTQISLVPRALQKASHPTKPQDGKPDSSGDKNISTATTTTSQAMSNAEFRKFLTK